MVESEFLFQVYGANEKGLNVTYVQNIKYTYFEHGGDFWNALKLGILHRLYKYLIYHIVIYIILSLLLLIMFCKYNTFGPTIAIVAFQTKKASSVPLSNPY